jgi:V/A-type H+-transporting ATPase subunit A
MLDTSLARRRHFPAINWSQSYSLYEKELSKHFTEQVSPRWEELKQRCREILRREESLREVTEIVGVEGLQDADRLLMQAAEKVRTEFLGQNAYTDDAFSPPGKTAERISGIVEFYEAASEKLKEGIPLDELLNRIMKNAT